MSVGIICQILFTMLGFVLTWVYRVFVHAVATTVNSYIEAGEMAW